MASWQLRRRRAVTVVVLVTLLASISADAQKPGFLSIDCGATSTYIDTATGITWVPDTPYVKTGSISRNVTSQLYSSLPRYTSLRFFPGSRSKFCYELPATNGTAYIVRTTFLYGYYDGREYLPEFRVQIDSLDIGRVQAKSSDAAEVIEVITAAVAKTIFVCLAPIVPGTDVPFISFIELRPLGSKMYPKAQQGYMMISSFRFNWGGENISYPTDAYDRHWASSPVPNVPYQILPAARFIAIDPSLCRDEPPKELMKSAISWPRDVEFVLPFNVSGDRNYVVLLWLAETAWQALNQRREFEVGIDGDWQKPIDVFAVTGGLYRGYEWGYESVMLGAESAIGFRAVNGSDLGPILNGMEVYALSEPVLPRTDARDVVAIESIKTHWNLSSWTGDPCLSLPYDWTFCSVDVTTRVTKLELAGYNLTGSVPVSGLGNLTELTALRLENNTLTGAIPDLSALTKLQQLHLQNNDLTGEFPAWVVNLSALQELFLDGNNLTGSIPLSLLNKTGLNLTINGNPVLCSHSPSLCSGPLSESATVAAPATSSKSNIVSITIGCVAGVLALVALMISAVLFLLWRKQQRPPKRREYWKRGCDPDMEDSKAQTMAYSFEEVKAATQNFKDLLGQGSFGPVYRGTLSDGREVAVKRCRPSHKLEALEFFTEVELLSRVHHRNLASLVGYCQDAQEQILLYEHKTNSDLRTLLHADRMLLPWKTRLSIALDIALGLEYLHTGCNPCIIHRDVKPANILLTSRLNAKVANFSFPKFTSEQDRALEAYSLDVKSTAGYLDPEYITRRHLTEKSDVYGFGVVLLELISGQEAINVRVSDRNPNLVEWVRPLLAEGNLQAVVDPTLGVKYNTESMWKIAELGMVSVEPKAVNRPTMSDAVRDIRDAIATEESAQASSSPFSLSSVPSPGP